MGARFVAGFLGRIPGVSWVSVGWFWVGAGAEAVVFAANGGFVWKKHFFGGTLSGNLFSAGFGARKEKAERKEGGMISSHPGCFPRGDCRFEIRASFVCRLL